MTVAREYQKRGLNITQSDYYLDPETSESREIDVLGSTIWDYKSIFCKLTLVTECKSSADKPWVLFAADKSPASEKLSVNQRTSSFFGKQLLRTISTRKVITNLPFFNIIDNHGYSLAQALGGNNDVAYKAIMSAAKASSAMAHSVDLRKNISPTSIRIYSHSAYVFFPVVVIKSKLFRCVLNQQSTNMELDEIKRGILFWKNQAVGQAQSLIHIVTEAELPAFVHDAVTAFEQIKSIIETDAGKDFCDNLNQVTKKCRETRVSYVPM